MYKNILERHRIKNQSELKELTNIIASSIGAPCNPNKLANTFKSAKGIKISSNTIERYLSHLQDGFLIERAMRYDIRMSRDENGITTIGLFDFLLHDNSLENWLE